MSLDRLPSNKLSMTPELISNMLGVRREGVTEAAGKLQALGIIQYSRGLITVLDRPNWRKSAASVTAWSNWRQIGFFPTPSQFETLCQRYVRFSNRPFGVKRFQTIHDGSVDIAHGLALLFGIGTEALPAWGSRTKWNNLWAGLAGRLTAGQVQADIRSHFIHRPVRDIIPRLAGFEFLLSH